MKQKLKNNHENTKFGKHEMDIIFFFALSYFRAFVIKICIASGQSRFSKLSLTGRGLAR